MLHPPGFYYVKKPKRFVILPSDKSSERNLSCFFDIIKPRRMEHIQSEEPFSSDPYFSKFEETRGGRVPQKSKIWGDVFYGYVVPKVVDQLCKAV